MKTLNAGALALNFYLLFYCGSAFSEDCKPSEILKNDINTYDNSLQTWISYVNTVVDNIDKKDTSSIRFNYGDVNMNGDDAKALTSKFSNDTHYNFNQFDQVSILSSYLPDNRVTAFVECLKHQVSNIDIIVPIGSESKDIIQGTVKWHPRYPVPPIDGFVERKLTMTVTHGVAILGDGVLIAPQQSADFKVKRDDLNQPFALSVNIDAQSGDILSYPPIPKYKIVTALISVESPTLFRDDVRGLDPVTMSPLTCIVPRSGGMLLPSTAKALKDGGGPEWEGRNKVTIVQNDPSRICIAVSSLGVGCRKKCDTRVKGYLSATEAYFAPIQ
jgi:hypothetical protein